MLLSKARARAGAISTATVLGAPGAKDFRAAMGFKPAVGESAELERILAATPSLRPVPSEARLECYRDKWTKALENPAHRGAGGCDCPIKRLNGAQAWYLEEAALNAYQGRRGVIGSLRIGTGKTGIDILLPMALADFGVKSALLLIPPRLRAQFAADFVTWSRHFKTPNLAGSAGAWYPTRPVLRVMAYSELSSKSATDCFKNFRPDLVIADECQNLKDRRSTRGDRFIRYFANAAEGGGVGPILCAHSGSLTTRSIQDYFHLAALALRERSPLPIDPNVAEEWGGVLDPSSDGFVAPAGALKKLCAPGEKPKDAFYRRRNMTQGFLTTPDVRLPVKVGLRVRSPGPLPLEVTRALASIRRGERPDGEELTEASEVAMAARQAAVGIFMRWKFPHGEPEELILDWFRKRKAYFREVREMLKYRSEYLDSPGHLTDAAERAARDYSGKLPVWHCAEWEPWRDVKDRVRPESDTVWLSDFMLDDAAAWAAEAPGIVWSDHPAWAHRLAKMTGLTYYGGGPAADALLAKVDGGRSIIASIKAHGTGKNLQMFNRCLFVDQPSDAGIVEQAIGRLYRQGQTRDVEVVRYEHTSEYADAWTSVMSFSRYAADTQVYTVLFADVLAPSGRRQT